MMSVWGPRKLVPLAMLFLLALLPRLYSAQTLGWNWDYPGSFTLVNFDEGGSCRAALEGFAYSTFVGRQTIAIARVLGRGPPPGIAGDAARVEAYCHSPQHLRIARSWSAVTGALTVVLVGVIGLLLWPQRPAVAWTAAALLAVSGFHVSQSHSGTVDAPSVFFIYAFLALLVCAALRKSRAAALTSPLLLVPALWAKYWVFALFAYAGLAPLRVWRYVSHGMSARRLVLVALATAILLGLLTNSAFQALGLYPLLAVCVLWYLVIPWRRLRRPMVLWWLLLPLLAFGLCRIDLVAAYTTSGASGRFGSGFAAIGWHKWLRNLVNVPAVLLVGLGLPACLFIAAGVGQACRDVARRRAWLCLLLPVLAFTVYMAVLAPVTYYRHYLPLLPAAALLAACGLYATRWAQRRWFLALFFAWPALLALDMVSDYHSDPRIALRQWFASHPNTRVFYSFYVNPPVQALGNSRLFRPEYAFGAAAALRQAQYLILSENWYDTAFANELNGPLVDDLDHLIKTTPAYARFYRAALAGSQPHLQPEQALEVENFMPELVVHRALYGTFQLFVGDIRILRVIDPIE